VVAYTNAYILCSQILSLERWNIWHFHQLHMDILEIFILWFSGLFNHKTDHRLGYLSWEGSYTKTFCNLGVGSLIRGPGYSPISGYTLQNRASPCAQHHFIPLMSNGLVYGILFFKGLLNKWRNGGPLHQWQFPKNLPFRSLTYTFFVHFRSLNLYNFLFFHLFLDDLQVLTHFS
jgi:hypothetical protein